MKVDHIYLHAAPARHNGETTSIIRGPLLTAGPKPTFAPLDVELDGVWVIIPQVDGRRLRLPASACEILECAPEAAKLSGKKKGGNP